MHVKPALIDPVKHPTLYHDLPDDEKGKATLKVRDPRTRALLPPEGAEVPDVRFWHRRLIGGEVVLVVSP